MPIFELRRSLTALPCSFSTALRLCAAIFPRIVNEKKASVLQDRSPLKFANGARLRSTSGTRAPAGRVGLADELGIRNGADCRADVELLVALDGDLLRAAVGLAPHERHLVAELHAWVDDAERQHRLLVVAVAGEH